MFLKTGSFVAVRRLELSGFDMNKIQVITQQIKNKKDAVLLSSVLIALVLFVFSPLFRAEFIFLDDYDYVVNNPLIQGGLTGANLQQAFSSVYKSYWIPLTWVSYMIDVSIGGMNPLVFHAGNILLHAGVVMCLFLFLTQATKRMIWAFFVAALFAIHPLRVESVAWITERKDVLSGLFAVLSLIAYSRYAGKRSRAGYILCLIFLAAGLMTKPMLVTWPCVLLLLDIWPFKRIDFSFRSWAISLIEKIPHFTLSLLFSWLTFATQAEKALSDAQTTPLKERMMTAADSFLHYLSTTVWPFDLAVIYPVFDVEFPWWKILLGVFLALTVSVYAILYIRRSGAASIGWLWFLGMLVPVIGLIRVGYVYKADRFTYIPSIGLFMSVLWIVFELTKRRQQLNRAMIVFLIIALGWFSWISYSYSKAWRSSISLLEHTLQSTHQNVLAAYYLSEQYMQAGRPADALDAVKQCVQWYPDFSIAHFRAGKLQWQLGDRKGALASFQNAMRGARKTEFEQIYWSAWLKRAEGRPNVALAFFLKAVELSPSSIVIHETIAQLAIELKKYDVAEEHLRKMIEMSPNHAQAMNNLAWLLAETDEPRNLEEAVIWAEKAVELLGNENNNALDTLAHVYEKAGRPEDAERIRARLK